LEADAHPGHTNPNNSLDTVQILRWSELKTGTSIPDFQANLITNAIYLNFGPLASGMPMDICKALLSDSEKRGRDLSWKLLQSLANDGVDVNATAFGKPLRQPSQSGAKTNFIEKRWM
jgi:hypothetical protein